MFFRWSICIFALWFSCFSQTTAAQVQLDFQSSTSPLNQGFAVFGQIIDGIEVIDKIRKVATTDKPGFPGLPTTPVVIRSITRVSQ